MLSSLIAIEPESIVISADAMDVSFDSLFMIPQAVKC